MREHVVVMPDGARIAVWDAGDGPPLLLLHGIGGTRGQWRRLIKDLAPRFRVLAWDARGYGASTGPGVTRFDDFARDFVHVLDSFSVARALAVGHSMGGRILLEVAALAPERLAAVVLSATQPAYQVHLPPEQRAHYAAERRAMFAGERIRPEAVDKVIAGVLAEGASEAARAAMRDSFLKLRPEGFLAALTASVGMDRTDVLAAMPCPTLIVGGALDPICPESFVTGLATTVGQGPAVILPGVGHMPNLEAPALFLAAIRPFLEQHASKAG
jgi:pimeloyl-ACP methyl ester carboxylesterase